MAKLQEILSAALTSKKAAKISKIRPDVEDKLEHLVKSIESEFAGTDFNWQEANSKLAMYRLGLKDGFKQIPADMRSSYYELGLNDGLQNKKGWEAGNKAVYAYHGQLVFLLGVLQDEIERVYESAVAKVAEARPTTINPVAYLAQKIKEDSNTPEARRSAYGLSILLEHCGLFLYRFITKGAHPDILNSPVVDGYLQQGLMEILRGKPDDVVSHEFREAFMTISANRSQLDGRYTKIMRAIGLIDFGRKAGALRDAYAQLKMGMSGP